MADTLNVIGAPGNFSLKVEVGPVGRLKSTSALLTLALLNAPLPSLPGTDPFHPGYAGSLQGPEAASITVNRTRGTAPAHFYFVMNASGFTLPSWGSGPLAGELAHIQDLSCEWDFGDDGALYTVIDEIDNNGDWFPWDRVYDVGGGTRQKVSGPGRPSGATYLGVDSNVAYGPHVGRVFYPSSDDFDAEYASSGNRYITYTVTCYLLSRNMVRAGREAIPITQTVEVYDPRYQTLAADGNTYGFAANEVFEISTSGTFSPEVPVANRFSDWDTAYTDGIRDSARFWLRFRRGETHNMHFTGDITVPADGGLRFNTDYDRCFITAYGNPADPRPILDYTQSPNCQFYLETKTANSEQALADLEFKGPHSVVDPEGGIHLLKQSANGPVVSPSAGYGCVINCHSEGFKFNYQGHPNGSNYGFENCSWGGAWDFGFFSDIGVTNLSFSGVSGIDDKETVFGWHVAESSQNVPIGDRKNKEPNGKYGLPVKVHGSNRISHAGKIGQYLGYVSYNACHFRSIGGWGDGYQPGIRMGGNGEEDEPGLLRPSQTRVFTSQGQTVAAGTFKGTIYPNFKYFEGVYNQCIDNTGEPGMISFDQSGSKVQNVILQLLDTVPYKTGYTCLFNTRAPSYPQDSSIFDYKLDVSYNAVYDERSAATYVSRKGDLTLYQITDPCYESLTTEYNLIYSPNRPGTAGHNFPADTISHTMGIALDYPGARRLPDEDAWSYAYPETWDQARAVVYPDPDPTYAFAQPVMIYEPAPGSPDYRTGDNATAPVRDFFFRVRPCVEQQGYAPSRGPVEPFS